MGYTHYFQIHKEIAPTRWSYFIKGANSILSHAWDFDLETELNSEVVVINGKGELGHETLFISRTNTRWEFVKTNRKPYDDVVTAILILARYVFDEDSFSLSSDGSWSDWSLGRELFTEAMFLEPAEQTVFGNTKHVFPERTLA